MSNFLHGLGGGVGRGIGRFIGFLIAAIILFLVINLLDLDVKNDILNKILFLDVHAANVETNITSSLSIPTEYSGCSQSNGKYWADDGSSSTCHVFNVNTTYSGVAYSFEMVLKNAWVINEVAFVNITAMSTDFRNNNLYCSIENSSGTSLPCNLTFSSKSLLSISFVPTAVGNYTLRIYSSTYDAITGVNTFGIKKVVVKQTTGDNSDIINSQNQNTQDIINNNNSNTQDIINNNGENTQDIIDNQNSNTQDIIDNQNENSQKELENATCPVGPLIITKGEWGVEDGYLNSTGVVTSNSSYKVSPYIIIKPNTEYKLQLTGTSNNVYYCTYNATKALIGCSALNSRNITFTTNNNTGYMRISLGNTLATGILGPVCNNWEKEAQDLANKKLDDLGYTLTDDNIDNDLGSGFFNNFDDEDFGLSDIITLPLTTIQSLTSTSCVTLDIPVPFTNQSIHLPCMKSIYQQKVRGIYNLWVYASYGLVSYWIATDIFRMVKGFKDPEQDKVEVLDL